MRPEIKAYNFDWMLWSTVGAASKIADGSDKELERMLKYIPNYRGIAQTIFREGDAGKQFLKMTFSYLDNIMNAHKTGKKLSITTFCFSPAIFYAMDIVPITFELLTVLAGALWKRGSFDYQDFCLETGFPETACSSQKGTLGAYLAGLGEEIDMVVCDSPGVCDTNAAAFSFAASYLDKPFYQLNFPPKLVEKRVQDYHLADYKALISFLEKQTGKKLEENRLREILEEIKIQDNLIADLEDMERLVPNPAPPIYNLFIYAGRFMFAGKSEYTKLLKFMVKEAKSKAEKGLSGLHSGKENLRAFFFYIDHYMLNLSLWEWLDKRGITHIGNILGKYFPNVAPYAKDRQEETYTINTDNMDEMLKSIAELNARMPMVRTIRGPYDAPHMWLQDSMALAEMYKADCLIYNGTPGCRNTWGMVKLMARDTEKYGYPTHIMYGDAFDERIESWESTSERLDEFFKVRRLLS
ncbi:MAG: 2-hydroxyacyl-CoA dehydratase [Desulfobacterales bacterium]|nr:2-hydroxyacyl-CoA dehydratase [Desulfobacterales bacterium]